MLGYRAFRGISKDHSPDSEESWLHAMSSLRGGFRHGSRGNRL